MAHEWGENEKSYGDELQDCRRSNVSPDFALSLYFTPCGDNSRRVTEDKVDGCINMESYANESHPFLQNSNF